MSIHHASSGELIQIPPLGDKLADTLSTALLKASQLEVIRRVLLAGKSVPEHQVQGEMTLFCLEGVVEVRLRDGTQTLHPNELIFLEGNVPYALHAAENASLLITVALKNGCPPRTKRRRVIFRRIRPVVYGRAAAQPCPP